MASDILSDLLRAVRLRGAVFFYVSCREQWAADSPPAREIAGTVMPGCDHLMEFHMIAKGHGWAAVSGQAPVRLSAGDIVVLPQGDAHVMSSAPGVIPSRAEADWVFSPDTHKPVPVTYHHGVEEPGRLTAVEDADTVLVCGFLGCDLRPFNPLVSVLPRLMHVPADRAGSWITHVIQQAAAESAAKGTGSDAVLERLSELMFVDTVRRYLQGLPEDATGWLAGLRDRYVGRALERLHERPAHPWTVEELGREIGLSRSALHDRFVQYLGQPPMQYLANWRVQLGSRLLRDSNRTVADIASEVGYESEAAFSRAFKRLVGTPPAAWRRATNGSPAALPA